MSFSVVFFSVYGIIIVPFSIFCKGQDLSVDCVNCVGSFLLLSHLPLRCIRVRKVRVICIPLFIRLYEEIFSSFSGFSPPTDGQTVVCNYFIPT